MPEVSPKKKRWICLYAVHSLSTLPRKRAAEHLVGTLSRLGKFCFVRALHRLDQPEEEKQRSYLLVSESLLLLLPVEDAKSIPHPVAAQVQLY